MKKIQNQKQRIMPALLLCLLNLFLFLPTLSASPYWLWANFNTNDIDPARTAVCFLNSHIKENGATEIWTRIPTNIAVKAEIYASTGNLVKKADLDMSPGERWGEFRAQGIQPGKYRLRLIRNDGGLEAESVFWVEQIILPAGRKVPIFVDEPAGKDWTSSPVNAGIPFPHATISDAGYVRILDSAGKEVPSQIKTAGSWDKEGKDIKWVQAMFFADSSKNTGAKYFLEYGREARRSEVKNKIVINDDAGFISIDTGMLKARINKKSGTIIEEASINNKTIIKSGGLYLQNQNRDVFSSTAESEAPEITLLEAGPLRAIVRERGWYASKKGERLCRYDVQLSFYYNQPYFQVLHTWILTADSRKVQFADISLRLETAFDAKNGIFGIDDGYKAEPFSCKIRKNEFVSLIQEDFDVFKIKKFKNSMETEILQEGKRGGGFLGATGKSGGIMMHVRDMWEQYPTELEAGFNSAAVHFWPEHGFSYRHKERPLGLHRWPYSDGPMLDFQPREYVEKVLMNNEERVWGYDKINALGIAKTHEIWVELIPKADKPAALQDKAERFENMPAGRCDPEWMSATGVVRPFLPYDDKKYPVIEKAIAAKWEANANIRAAAHIYGFLHYGDNLGGLPFIKEDGTLYLYGTNKLSQAHRYWVSAAYRMGMEPWLLWLRSGRREYLHAAEIMTRHLMDIDFVNWGSTNVYPPRKPGYGNDQSFSHYNSTCGNGRVHHEPTGFGMMSYYLQGNQRAFELLANAGEVNLEAQGYDNSVAKGQIDRGVICQARIALDTYRISWDKKYFNHAWKAIGPMLDNLIHKKIHVSHTTYLWEFLYDLEDFTSDSRIKPALKSLTEAYMGKPLGNDRDYPVLYDFGHMYDLTGDTEYLAWGKGIMQMRLYDINLGDYPYRGRVSSDDPICFTRTILQVPGFLYYLNKAEKDGPIAARIQPIKFMNDTGSVHLLKEKDSDCRVRFYGSFYKNNKDAPDVTGKIFIRNSDGRIVTETPFNSGELSSVYGPMPEDRMTGSGYRDLVIPAAASNGVYILEMEFTNKTAISKNQPFYWGIGSPDIKKIAYQVSKFRFDGGHVFFYVPRGKTSFTINFIPVGGYFGEPVIIDRYGNEVFRIRGLDASRWRKDNIITVNLPADKTGDMYGLVALGGSIELVDREMPPYVYSDPVEFFLPAEVKK